MSTWYLEQKIKDLTDEVLKLKPRVKAYKAGRDNLLEENRKLRRELHGEEMKVVDLEGLNNRSRAAALEEFGIHTKHFDRNGNEEELW